MSEHNGADQNGNKGTEKGQSGSPNEGDAIRKYPKTHQDFWKDRLRKRTYRDKSGIIHEVSDWQVRMKYAGQEAWFNLKTANKVSASIKARDIYLVLVSEGWDAALEKFKDTPQKKNHEPTIGEFLIEVAKVSSLRPSTLNEYTKNLRLIAADICGIDKSSLRDDPSNGRERWLERINGIKLNRITPKKVQQWKLEYLRKRSEDPAEEKSAKVTVNSTMRNAKSLFSERILKYIELNLPDPLPFDGVEFERIGRATRYKSNIDPAELTRKAFEEFKDDNPESFKIFLLAISVGLRRGEIDSLMWSQIDLEESVIRIETHEYAQLITWTVDKAKLDAGIRC